MWNWSASLLFTANASICYCCWFLGDLFMVQRLVKINVLFFSPAAFTNRSPEEARPSYFRDCCFLGATLMASHRHLLHVCFSGWWVQLMISYSFRQLSGKITGGLSKWLCILSVIMKYVFDIGFKSTFMRMWWMWKCQRGKVL